MLCFNGIGATGIWRSRSVKRLPARPRNLFDVPRVELTQAVLPCRPATLAQVGAGLVAELGHAEIDVAGVSGRWNRSSSIVSSKSKLLSAAGASRRHRPRRHDGAGKPRGCCGKWRRRALPRQVYMNRVAAANLEEPFATTILDRRHAAAMAWRGNLATVSASCDERWTVCSGFGVLSPFFFSFILFAAAVDARDDAAAHDQWFYRVNVTFWRADPERRTQE